jgi:hypothetical protein
MLNFIFVINILEQKIRPDSATDPEHSENPDTRKKLPIHTTVTRDYRMQPLYHGINRDEVGLKQKEPMRKDNWKILLKRSWIKGLLCPRERSCLMGEKIDIEDVVTLF